MVKAVANIPAQADLNLASHASASSSKELPPAAAAESSLKRDEWMLAPEPMPVVPDADARLGGPPGSVDFFSDMGIEHKKKPPPRVVEQVRSSFEHADKLLTSNYSPKSALESSTQNYAKVLVSVQCLAISHHLILRRR